jgi:hypothetical protein
MYLKDTIFLFAINMWYISGPCLPPLTGAHVAMKIEMSFILFV